MKSVLACRFKMSYLVVAGWLMEISSRGVRGLSDKTDWDVGWVNLRTLHLGWQHAFM